MTVLPEEIAFSFFSAPAGMFLRRDEAARDAEQKEKRTGVPRFLKFWGVALAALPSLLLGPVGISDAKVTTSIIEEKVEHRAEPPRHLAVVSASGRVAARDYQAVSPSEWATPGSSLTYEDEEMFIEG